MFEKQLQITKYSPFSVSGKTTEGHNEVHISNMMTIQFIIHFERQTVKFRKKPNSYPDQNQHTMGFNFAVF